MQLHQLKLKTKKKTKRRIGRGGKRGGYSGKGQKGQKSRAGARIGPDFRGGNAPIWKLFPKQRGATKKTKIKHRTFSLHHKKAQPLNLEKINNIFSDGEKVNLQTLFDKHMTDSLKDKVKILADGTLDKKLEFENLPISKSAKKKILEAGGIIR